MQPFGTKKKSHILLGQRKIMQPLEMKKITQPLRAIQIHGPFRKKISCNQKKHGTSQDEKIMQPLGI